MSSATKRKHVTKESQEECLTVPEESQSIVQVIESKGNNLHEVMESTGAQYLVSMPGKFRRNIWVKRGNYVIVEPIPEGDKVKAEIVKILTKVKSIFEKLIIYLILLIGFIFLFIFYRIILNFFERTIVGQINLMN